MPAMQRVFCLCKWVETIFGWMRTGGLRRIRYRDVVCMANLMSEPEAAARLPG